MINSVWNLCRACPSNTEEKYREYQRNGGWQPGGAPYTPTEVVRRQPEQPACSSNAPNASGALEPALPRKKKYPDSAYRSNQVLRNLDYPGGPAQAGASDGPDAAAKHLADFRARSEERTFGKLLSGPRSRSADPSLGRRRPQEETEEDDVNADVNMEPRPGDTDDDGTLMTQSYPPPSSTQQLNECHAGSSTVPKTTEYRSQFAWPQASAVLLASEARKSLSMGAIAHPAPAATHQAPRQDEGTTAPDGPAVAQNEEEETPKSTPRNKVTEYKAKFRPFSSYLYVDGNWRKSPKAAPTAAILVQAGESEPLDESHAWYAEVVERLKKADEYRSRAHGLPGGVTSSDQPVTSQERRAELWNQVRERSNLVALTLATSSSRPVTGAEEKLTSERPAPAARQHRTPPSTHKKDIRPISAERKKSPATEVKAKTPVEPKTAPPAAKHAPTRTSRADEKTPGSAGHRVTSAGPSSGASSSKGSTTPTPVIRPRTKAPAASSAPSETTAGAANGGEDGKIWLKPQTNAADEKDSAQPATEGQAAAPNTDAEADDSKKKDEKRQERPCSLPGQVNGAGSDAVLNGGQDYPSPSPLPEPHVGPVPLTTVRSPEELTGVKSPDPETWTVPLETNRGLEWMDGHTPEMTRVKSPPLTGPLKEVVTNQPTGSPDLPSTPDAVPSKISGEESVVAGPKVENMVSSADVLDRARSRLDQFWSKSK